MTWREVVKGDRGIGDGQQSTKGRGDVAIGKNSFPTDPHQYPLMNPGKDSLVVVNHCQETTLTDGPIDQSEQIGSLKVCEVDQSSTRFALDDHQGSGTP